MEISFVKNKWLALRLCVPGVLMALYLLAHCYTCYATTSYYFRHYTVENGLSNNCVTSILQDKTGFLWIGTKDGLNRFDGYSFKTFRKSPVKGAIGSNYIHTIYEDKQGVLWIGTENGLYRYAERTESFQLVPATFNLYIVDIKEDKKGNLWLLSSGLLYRYKKQLQRLEFIDHRKLFTITHLCTTADGTLWAGTIDGYLKRFNAENNSFSSFNLFKKFKSTDNKWIESLYYTSDGYIVAGTSNTEIKLFDPRQLSYTDITLPYIGQTNLYIRSVLQTSLDEIWLGTESGVFIYNRKTKHARYLKKDYSNPYALTDNAVYVLCQDREGGIWFGTYFGGINYLPKQSTPFIKYYPGKEASAIVGNVVREIKKDDQNNIWIGTEDAGINRLDLQTQQFTNYQPPASGISFANIHGLLVHGNELWIGTLLHGLDVMDIKTGKVLKHYNVQNGSGFTHDFIYGIYKIKGDIVVISPHGAFSFNKATGKFEWFRGLPKWVWYTSVTEDHSGRIWATSFGSGIYYYDPATGKNGNYRHEPADTNSLSNNLVNAVFEDSDHQLWFTTNEGLSKLDKATGKFARYGTKNGFPSDFMFSILEDDERRLWISTTKGLACFSPSRAKVQSYTTANGLLSDQFNYNSAFKDTDGRMYFGSTKGLISFHPKEFTHSTQVSPVILTGFFINEKELSVNKKSPLTQSVTHTDEIILPYNQSTFSIDFASLSFTAPEIIHYSYQMEGLSRNWVNINANRRVDFVGLPPGKYNFSVKAIRTDGIESSIKNLKIKILPPWWLSPAAYIMYFTFALLIIAIVVQKTNKRIKEKNNRKLELLKIANEKEMLEMELVKEKELLEEKINFFTNVAHEIKTPLTLIKVPLAKVIKKTGNRPDLKYNLDVMSRNTNRLLELSNQLLDFRQTEIGKFKISLKRVDITKLVTEACLGFSDLAEERQLLFRQNMPADPFFAFIDEDAFNKIIYNLFSNAVKYAGSKVSIALLPFKKNNHTFTIEVKNDGYLVPAHLMEKIFEPFYRLEQTEMEAGSGIGLALSRSLAHLHNGSLILEDRKDEMNTFSLTLPIKMEQEKNINTSHFIS